MYACNEFVGSFAARSYGGCPWPMLPESTAIDVLCSLSGPDFASTEIINKLARSLEWLFYMLGFDSASSNLLLS